MQDQSMYLSVVIPAYNEAERIASTLASADSYLRRQNYPYEVIVVNDGSTDATAEVVEGLMKSMPCVRIINNKKNHGKGWVVRMGMLSAKGSFRLFMDADNSTSIDHLDAFLPQADQGFDAVIGSRRVKGAKIEVKQNIIRDFLGGVFRFIVGAIVPLGVVDSQNGFKIFSSRAAEDIFRRQRTFTWSFDVEVLSIARLLGYKIREMPVHWVNDGRSHVTFASMIRMLYEVAEIRINLWTGTYYSEVAEKIQIG